MRAQIRSIASLVLTAILVACGSTEEQEPAEAAGVAVAAPGAMMQDTIPTTVRQMRIHLRQMEGVHGDSLRAMLPMHRQMLSGMMGHMRGMPMMMGDPHWNALMDSVHHDMNVMEDVSGMSAEELERWMSAHRGRVLRITEMHPGMHRHMP